MDGIKSLLSNEHGIAAVLFILCATVLCALKIMTVEDWQNFAKVIFAAFAGTSAIVTGMKHYATGKQAQAQAAMTNQEKKS